MSKKRVGAFTIEGIECFNWKLGSGSALVRATNLEGDSVEFSMYRHPEDFTVVIIEEAEVLSTLVQPYELKEIVEREIQILAEKEVLLWWGEIQRIKELLEYRADTISAGVTPPDSFYTLVAYLYGIRQVYSHRKIVECMAEDMSIKVDACRERIRRCRDKGLLTSPGRGKVGKGRLTKKAHSLLEQEGILKAKSPIRKKGWI